ncbi:MAG: hypothetical protein WDO73_18010 [Ignavibacteriota bacterium]
MGVRQSAEEPAQPCLVLGARAQAGALRNQHPVWGFKGRCIGNGGFPAFRDDLPGVGGQFYQWIHLGAQPFAPKATLLDGPNFWITQSPESFSPHGYVFLQFDGDTVTETYRVPNNIGLLKQQV